MFLWLFSCQNREKSPPSNSYHNLVEIETFPVDSISWGYNILVNKHIYIHQPIIPAIEGQIGFSSEKEARTTAKLIVIKIKQKKLPPTVSIKELDSLGINHKGS